MKSFGLVIKEMHWPRLQVFMRFLVNYSYGVCVLLRLQPSLGVRSGWLPACAEGKNVLASRSASPDWGSIPREETGTGAGQDLSCFGLRKLWFCPRCRSVASPSEAGGAGSRGSPSTHPEGPVPRDLQGWGCSTGMLVSRMGGAESPGLACLLVLKTIKNYYFALFWVLLLLLLFCRFGCFFLFCDFFSFWLFPAKPALIWGLFLPLCI